MVQLLRWILICCLLFVGVAHGAIPALSGYKVSGSPDSTARLTYAEACIAYVAYMQVQDPAKNYRNPESLNPQGYGCRYLYDNPGPTQNIATFVSVSAICPANSTTATGGCQCNAGYVEDPTKTSCVAPLSELEQFCKDNAAGKYGFNQSGTVAPASAIPSASCYKPYPPFEGADAEKGCRTTLGDAVGWLGDDGKKHWSSTGVMTGETCEDAAATDEAPKSAVDPCPSGFPGTVNGVAKCIAVEPDKGIEGVKGTSQTNADGTKIDSKETTKCVASVCTTTTTTTTTTSTGSTSTSTSSRTESIGDKCEKDPKNKVCQKTQGGVGGATSQMGCEQNSSAEGCGGEGADVGELYTKKDKTVAQALKKATDALQASPIGSAVGGFFSVGSGGSCSAISGTIPYLNATFVFDAYCGSMAANLFLILRAVLLMVASWAAFRIAIDH